MTKPYIKTLDDTSWTLYDIIGPIGTGTQRFVLDFSSGATTFTSMTFEGDISEGTLYFDSTPVVSYPACVWADADYKALTIAGGVDAANPSLLAWFSQYARSTSPSSGDNAISTALYGIADAIRESGSDIPDPSTADVGDVLTKGEDGLEWAAGERLPAVTALDDGDVLGVVSGVWDKMPAPAGEPNMVNITYSSLKTLRDNGDLVPGTLYRITDYSTIITGSYDLATMGGQGYLHNAVTAGHDFDIIVMAADASHLNECAWAALHSGDTYFANSNLGAWTLKYSLDNDSTKYAWANPNGKGVIYWMEDEFNNRAGYDFKNIQFVRYALARVDNTSSMGETLEYNAAADQFGRYGSFY